MRAAHLRSEERIGLIIALAAHVMLVAVLVLRPPVRAPFPLPERMTVTLSDDVGLTSTSPQLTAQPAPDIAPVLGEAPPPPAPSVKPLPAPRVAPVSAPLAPPRAVTKQAAKPPIAPRRPPAATGGSRIGNDFLKGVSGARTNGPATNPPAAALGAAERSALISAISREIKPRWVSPQGADVEKLVTYVTFNLNRDGSLAGPPRMTRQEGINDANRAQAQRHGEQAIRAVQLAAPYSLPPEFYGTWKRVTDFRFDRRLSQ